MMAGGMDTPATVCSIAQTDRAGRGIVVISHKIKHYHIFSFTQSTLTANDIELATILKLTDVYQKY